jgi:hypothetical protein
MLTWPCELIEIIGMTARDVLKLENEDEVEFCTSRSGRNVSNIVDTVNGRDAMA